MNKYTKIMIWASKQESIMDIKIKIEFKRIRDSNETANFIEIDRLNSLRDRYSNLYIKALGKV